MPDDISSPASAPPIRVVIADDNPVVRAGLAALLAGGDGMVVVGEAKDGRQAYEHTARLRPDVVLLDVRMPGVDGLAALPHLVRLAKVLMMTYSRESETIRQALHLGAAGYLVHGEFTADQLISAVRDVRHGKPRFTHSASRVLGRPPAAIPEKLSAHAHAGATGPSVPATSTGPGGRVLAAEVEHQKIVQTSLLSQVDVGHSLRGSQEPGVLYSELSQREVEIMDLIASGMTNQEIAAACFISQKTVKNHINRIFAKLNATSRGEAIARWHGIARRGAVDNG
jgi:DNA-binding NarL/FixJ family response regulator